ncbi:AlwI family type II restriction endonuclease, partial [Niallia circulans]|uniref:AlwI family type II restriction endonuclease n=1 Tax=Niallia circulans TaxID=1397 RepID=UPI0015618879
SIKLLSREDKIKKAFGSGKIPFKFTRNETVDEFLIENEQNPLLSPNPYNIYLEFIFSKHNDLIREYSDMCRRTFEITALISFEKGLVNLANEWIIKPLIDILNDGFILCGDEDFEEYEGNMNSSWFTDLTIKDILNISDVVLNDLMLQISKDLGMSDLTNLNDTILNKREQEYRDFVNTHFPKEKVIEILREINSRNDTKVFEMVTENASVPTIYEYILTIAWYHISDEKDYYLHKSFQVTLDGSKLPLTHRGGGAGDIEIITSKYALLIEATLMDKNTQKRGELEPVIRHSINFALNNKDSAQIQTIFIANELDNNVINLFRATQFVQHSGTNLTGQVDGMNIFAMTTSEFIMILESEKDDQFILNTIIESADEFPTIIKNDWREPIIQKILS